MFTYIPLQVLFVNPISVFASVIPLFYHTSFEDFFVDGTFIMDCVWVVLIFAALVMAEKLRSGTGYSLKKMDITWLQKIEKVVLPTLLCF